MTKLMQWLFVLNLFFAVYLAIITKQIKSDLLNEWMFEIQILPAVLIILFGVYSVFIILYRVFTFNDCHEAAEEIQRQIKEAKADLLAKGFKFTEKIS